MREIPTARFARDRLAGARARRLRRPRPGNGGCATLGLVAGDLDDSKSSWAVERRKIASGEHDGVVIIGGSRILFDTDLDVWQEMTGRRPVQLALPGMSGQRFLADLADNSDFDGLVAHRRHAGAVLPRGAGQSRVRGRARRLGRTRDPRSASVTGSGNSCRATSHSSTTSTRSRSSSTRSTSRTAGRSGRRICMPWKLSENYDDRQYGPVARNRDERAPAGARHSRLACEQAAPPPAESLIARDLCRRARIGREDPRARRRSGLHSPAVWRVRTTSGSKRTLPRDRDLGPAAARERHVRHPFRGLSGDAGSRDCRSCRTSRASRRRASRAPMSACYVSGT